MINDQLIHTIIQAGITGAGLIFAAYGIIIAFSEKLKEFREKRIEEARSKLDKTKPVKELKEITEEIELSESTPLYFSWFVIISFLLYTLSVILGLFFLNSTKQDTSLATASYVSFIVATILFGLIGLALLNDFLDFMKDFLKLTGKKK